MRWILHGRRAFSMAKRFAAGDERSKGAPRCVSNVTALVVRRMHCLQTFRDAERKVET